MESGADALEALRRAVDGDPFRLVVMDMQMPVMDGCDTARRIQADGRFGDVPLILLSSMGALQPAREIGFAAALAKPVRQATLLRTVLSVLGGGDPDPDHAPAPKLPDVVRARVLLADDNKINRMVALAMLRRFGCDTDVVEDGRAAVEAVMARHYDLVLMDVQMPEMDGFEATAEIRRLLGERPLPIIAMTAHAMEGDAERCLAAGMDDYIGKPVTFATLGRALVRWTKSDVLAKTGPVPEGGSAGSSAA